MAINHWEGALEKLEEQERMSEVSRIRITSVAFKIGGIMTYMMK